MKDGSLDFYIRPRKLGELDTGYEPQFSFRNTRLVVCRQDHPLADASSLRELLTAD